MNIIVDPRPRIEPPTKGGWPQWQVSYIFHQWEHRTAGTATIYAECIHDAIVGVEDGFGELADHEWVEIVRAEQVVRR